MAMTFSAKFLLKTAIVYQRTQQFVKYKTDNIFNYTIYMFTYNKLA